MAIMYIQLQTTHQFAKPITSYRESLHLEDPQCIATASTSNKFSEFSLLGEGAVGGKLLSQILKLPPPNLSQLQDKIMAWSKILPASKHGQIDVL